MAVKKPGLGRGLDALLAGTKAVQVAHIDQQQNQDSAATLIEIPIDKIVRGSYQPRRNFDQQALQELADSIAEQGVLQPIVVREVNHNYEIIAGERRWRASGLAKKSTIPAIVKNLDDRAVAAAALIENIQREELNPLEEAMALDRLIVEFELTHQDAATAVGRSRAAVSNLLRLLELPEEVKQHLNKTELSMGHARALLPLDKSLQIKLAAQVIANRMSVRELENTVKKLSQRPKNADNSTTDPNIIALQNKLSETLMAKVKLSHQKNGKGKLQISYNSLEELEGILKHIK